jgi:hypothetical protein
MFLLGHIGFRVIFDYRPNSNIAAFLRNKTSVFRNYTGTLLQYIEFDGYFQTQQAFKMYGSLTDSFIIKRSHVEIYIDSEKSNKSTFC